MSLNTLDDLFLHELKDTYDAEKRMTKALPKMARTASSKPLKAALQKHLKVTENQIKRLEKVFDLLDETPRGKKCLAMTGIVDEGAELMQEDGSESALDAALIGAAQKAEHYEIAAYGTLATYAGMLGLKEAQRLLKQTLAEEKETDDELSRLAKKINFQAEKENEDEPKKPARSGQPKFIKQLGKTLAKLTGQR
jgi:ferritin-like metal-binding protein YciE